MFDGKVRSRCWAEWCPQSNPEDQLSHVQPGPNSDLHTALPGLHRVSPYAFYSLMHEMSNSEDKEDSYVLKSKYK